MKYFKRGTAIRICDTLLDPDGDLVTSEDNPYMLVTIDILSPYGYPVVYAEEMEYDIDGKSFYYIWQSERTDDVGKYTIEISAILDEVESLTLGVKIELI